MTTYQPLIQVVSTGLNAPTKRLCLDSVRNQSFRAAGHHYVEAAASVPDYDYGPGYEMIRPGAGKTASQNLYEAIRHMWHRTVVVWLDGDDWLAHPDVLRRVWDMHQDGAWLTYGQYVDQDGKPGHCRLHDHEDYRSHPFVASHLKTFRAGLFQKLAPEDLQLDGEWVSLGVDVAVMLPLLELAGPKRTRFCPEVLCVYHRPTSWEASASPAALAKEQDVVARLRAKPRKERLECL